MNNLLNILYLENNPDDVRLINTILNQSELKFKLYSVDNERDFKTALNKYNPDLILSEFKLDSYKGKPALNLILKRTPKLPFIFLFREHATKINAPEGADDYILKSQLEKLTPAIKRILRERRRHNDIDNIEIFRRNSDKRIISSFNNLGDAFIIFEINGKVLDCNPASERMFAYHKSELSKLTIQDLIHEDMTNLLNIFRAKEQHIDVSAAQVERLELSAQPKIGQSFPVELSLSMMKMGTQRQLVGIIHDITERLQIRQELKESQRLLQGSQSLAQIGSWSLDPVTMKTVWSPEMFKICGIKPDVDTDLDMLSTLIHPDDTEQVMNSIFYAVNHKSKHHLSYRIIRPDNSIRWVECHGEPIENKNSASFTLMGYLQDITLRINTAEKLCQNRKKLQQTQKIVHLGSWELKEPGHQLHCSAEIYRIYGLDPNKTTLHYTDLLEKVHPEDKNIVERKYFNFVSKHIDYDIEHRLLMSDGEIRFVNQKTQIHYDHLGHIESLAGTVLDVTEYKTIEQALRTIQTEYSSIIHDLPALIRRNKIDGSILFVNKTYSNYFAKEPEELIGSSLFANIPVDEHAQIKNKLNSLNKNNPLMVLEHKVTLADDSIAYQRWTNRAICDEHDHILYIQAYGEDITERKMQDELNSLQKRRTEAMLKLPSASEQMNESEFMQFGQELTENLTRSKISFVHFINKDEQSIELVTWSKRTLENYCQAVFEKHYSVKDAGIWADALRKHQPVIFNDYSGYQHKSGLPEGHSELTRLISVPVIENNKVVMITGVGNKDTEYNETDVETVQLISNEIWRIVQHRRKDIEIHKLVQAVEQSPESIVITNCQAEIEYVNQSFVATTGYQLEEIIGQNPRILQAGQTPAKTFKDLWSTLGQQKTWKGEFYNKTKAGKLFVELAIIAPIRQEDGTITHYLAVKEDITEKKHLEQELEKHRHHLENLIIERTQQLELAKKKAEQANQAKSAFLANMSHEIRTPMHAIMGLSQLMLESEQNPKNLKRLDKITFSANHLLNIINDILDFSTIEANKVLLKKVNFNINSLFNQILSILQDQIKDNKLTLQLDISEAPTWLIGDETRLKQAIFNYTGNAIKFTQQGSISLSAKTLEETASDYLLRFAVQDTGIGIEHSLLPSLFKAFEQGDISATKNYEGTGLGLAINHQLARLMDGSVGVESTPGQGSTFWFTARLGKGHAEKATKNASEQNTTDFDLTASCAGSHILVVEDNPINQDILVDLLTAKGLSVETAKNGQEAVDLSLVNHYDLILMDIQMPVMDGLEATRLIHSIKNQKHTPILAITANVFSENQQACLMAGMVDFISKPFNLEELYTKLKKWLIPLKSKSTADEYYNKESATIESSQEKLLSTNPAIEVQVLKELFGQNSEKIAVFLNKFEQQANAIIADILKAYELQDIKEVAFLAHKFKSSARMVGANQLADLCLALEQEAKQNHSTEVDKLCQQLKPEYESIKKFINNI